MKAFIVLLAIVGLACGAPNNHRARRSLTADLTDLLKILPFDKITEIETSHLKSDGAFVAVIEYLQGKDFHDLVDSILADKGVMKFIGEVEKLGIKVDDLLNPIDEAILAAKPQIKADPKGSLSAFLADIQKAVPLTTLLGFVNDKLQNSVDVQKLYVALSSEDSKKTTEGILKLPEVVRLAGRLNELGLEVGSVLDFIFDFLGWGKAPKIS